MRGQARRDVATMVARAIKRRGYDPTNWSVADADAAHVIADMLVRLLGQEPSPFDPAFETRFFDSVKRALEAYVLGVAEAGIVRRGARQTRSAIPRERHVMWMPFRLPRVAYAEASKQFVWSRSL
jgi:hypothetical protein